MLQALTQAHRSEGLQEGSRILSCVSQLPTPTSGAVAYQLVVADRQVSYFSPVDHDHIKAALWLPAVHAQRILEAAVQAAAIRAEEHTPGRKAGGQSGTAFPPCSVLLGLWLHWTPSALFLTMNLAMWCSPVQLGGPVQHLQQPKLLPSKASLWGKPPLHPTFSLCPAHFSRNLMYLTGVASSSIQLTTWNFSKSQNRTVLYTQHNKINCSINYSRIQILNKTLRIAVTLSRRCMNPDRDT